MLVLGTVALDTIKTPFGRKVDILGGSAAHFSMSCRLFTDVNLVAVVGFDFPEEHAEFLEKKGINLSSLTRDKGATFKWEGEYQGDLNSATTLHTELGVLADFRPVITEEERKTKHIFLANVDPDIQRHVLEKIKNPSLIGLDTMNYWITHRRPALLKVLKMAGIFLVNEHEARSLSGESNLLKAAKCLAAFGPKMILIKKGEHGALFYSDKFIVCLPGFPTEEVIDPTGAGDTFAGGFMGYLAKSKKIDARNIKRAIACGSIAASFNVEGFGLERTATLKLKDLEDRLAKFKKIAIF